MIFVTVGSQLPFDRLIGAVDEICANLSIDAFAQIGRGSYVPKNIPWERKLSAQAFDELMGASRLVVSHAGIGSILAAQRWGKPIVLVPRLARFGEHRNDHQLATLRALGGRSGLYPVEDLSSIGRYLTDFSLTGPVADDEPESRAKLKKGIHEIIMNSFN